LNELEAYIYKIKEKFSDEEKNIALVSTETQRNEVSTLLEEAQEWLDGK
jgi:hypothetical protein